jgi:hypothetical protein
MDGLWYRAPSELGRTTLLLVPFVGWPKPLAEVAIPQTFRPSVALLCLRRSGEASPCHLRDRRDFHPQQPAY